ncbi:methyltransferase [Streptomyces flavidovirens]|uniref:methyltransferase n=1 Tax=Streptomyces flavidovirens TaxID=67298 RepID=UPI003433FAED
MPDNHPGPHGDIEELLARHEQVAQAVVLPREDPATGGPGTVAYVLPTAESADGPEAGAQAQVQEWQQIYDRVYAASSAAGFGENFSGWNSSYDGRPIDLDEMRGWRAATVDRIRALEPRRILEIGVGSGLLLARLAPDCEVYWATDVSATAIDELSRHVTADPRLADRVVLRAQSADRVDGLPTGYFDTVVINSVTQCFPNGEYLTTVIERALDCLAPGGVFFIGDNRDLRTLDDFHTAVALRRTDAADPAAVTRAMEKSRARDEELLVHPDYFAALAALDPKVAAVDVQLEGGDFHNEMTRHRFDVVLYRAPVETVDVSGCATLRWGSDIDDLRRLTARLAEADLPVRVTGIPNARIVGECGARDALAEGDVHLARQDLGRLTASAVDPHALVRIADKTGLHLALVPSPERRDCFEAVFSRPASARTALVGAYRSSPAAAVRTQVPAATHRSRRLAGRLHAWLREQLPEDLVPTAVLTVDRLPLRPDAGIDR